MKKSEMRAKVALRVRPLSSEELSDGCQSVIRFTEQQQVILSDEKIYDFDYLFNAESTQNDVYENCASDLVDKVFAGYNVTIFAYGQTGSGKTYTMGTSYNKKISCDESCGIIPRLLEDVFKTKNNRSSSKIQVSFTFVEIYNEILYDLTTSKTQQPRGLREAPSAVKHMGTRKTDLNSCEEALQLFEEGCSRRVQEKTSGNQYSSRSHAIYTLNITKYNKKGDAVTSKLNLVDLAGSEACSRNLNSNNRYKEGININLSLLTLGKVIRALRDTSNIAQSTHIPYRDSLLTHLLKDSLNSKCFILMIACVNPAKYCLTETLTTLSYAATVCCIKTRPIVKNSTAKKVFRNPLQTLPPTPAWVKQGLNLTIATPTIQPTPAKEFHPYRRTVIGTIQREVQDSGCSPMFKEPFLPRLPSGTPYQSNCRPVFQSTNNTAPAEKLQFPPPSRTMQRTLKDYFTPGVRCIDKENFSEKETHKPKSFEKRLSTHTPLTMPFLSPVPMQNFTCLTPLRDRTNIYNSPALNTRSCGKKHTFTNSEDQTTINNSPAFNTRNCGRKRSFANIEELSDSGCLLTLKKHSASKKMSLMVPVNEGEKENLRDSPAFNTRGRNSHFLHSIDGTLTSPSTLSKEKSVAVPSFISTGENALPIPLPDLDDEIFDLPRICPSVKKYNLRSRLTISYYEHSFDLWESERKRKVRKTELPVKVRTMRRSTQVKINKSENGFTGSKQTSAKSLKQQAHEENILKLLNKGLLKDLQKLPSVGPKTAYIIFTWRNLKGPFRKISDLKQIIGLQPTFFTKFAKTNLISF